MSTDRVTTRIVVMFLGVVVLAGLGIGGVLAYQDKGTPDFIIGTVSAALGALGAILARPDGGLQQVVGPLGGPVPTEEANENPARAVRVTKRSAVPRP